MKFVRDNLPLFHPLQLNEQHLSGAIIIAFTTLNKEEREAIEAGEGDTERERVTGEPERRNSGRGREEERC